MLVAVTVGLYVSGLVGVVVAIPVAGTIKVFLEDYLERAKHERVEQEKPLKKLAKKLQGAK